MASLTTLLLLLLLSADFSVHADVSIDCGSSTVSTDENLTVWIGDDTLISNGEIAQVQTTKSVAKVFTTLRVFKSRKKNCYSIQVDTTTSQVLVRASFYYGNYDGKSAPPSFDLQFDGNEWATVVTSSDDVVYYEAVYLVKSDITSVCVAQTTPNQFPFMSALELRTLGNSMYSHTELAMFLTRRVAYGAPSIVRFPDDPYDRIWNPSVVSNGLVVATSDATFIDVSGVEDDPPTTAIQNAITTSTVSQSITLATSISSAELIPIYITMYFSEVMELDSTQLRSFQVYIDGAPVLTDPILPPYGRVTEIYITNFTASSNTNVSLVSTTDSTLPPLINAMEVFNLAPPLTDGTNGVDVDGLVSLQNEFTSIQDWRGDPCLPSPYTWDWVNCTSGAIPRITALYLSSYDLSGTSIPDFSSMDALEIIDLHNNSLTGPIPDFLGSFPNLRSLNLADNGFSGPVPSSLTTNTKLKLVISGNPDLCTSGKSCSTTTSTETETDTGGSTFTSSTGGKKKKKKKNNLPAILGGVIPGFIIFWALVGTLTTLHRKRKRAALAATIPGNANKPNGNPMASPAPLMNDFKVNMEEQASAELFTQVNEEIRDNQHL